MQSVISDGRRIAYQDIGRGPALILAHCSSASHREWSTLTGVLQDRYRILAPDLIGYGKSDRWVDGATLPPSADPGVLLRLTSLVEGPVHLAGHSYGAAAALEAALVLGDRLQSLTLIEPVSFHLLRTDGHPEWNAVNQLAARVNGALAAGRKQAAAATYMSFWIGRLRWWLMPAKARRKIVDTVGKVAAEFAMLRAMTRAPNDYDRIITPTRLIYGQNTRRAAKAVIEILARTWPHADVAVVPGAGHMSPLTHPEAVTRLIAEHIDRRPAESGSRV